MLRRNPVEKKLYQEEILLGRCEEALGKSSIRENLCQGRSDV